MTVESTDITHNPTVTASWHWLFIDKHLFSTLQTSVKKRSQHERSPSTFGICSIWRTFQWSTISWRGLKCICLVTLCTFIKILFYMSSFGSEEWDSWGIPLVLGLFICRSQKLEVCGNKSPVSQLCHFEFCTLHDGSPTEESGYLQTSWQRLQPFTTLIWLYSLNNLKVDL